jgi:hypothetical protein
MLYRHSESHRRQVKGRGVCRGGRLVDTDEVHSAAASSNFFVSGRHASARETDQSALEEFATAATPHTLRHAASSQTPHCVAIT